MMAAWTDRDGLQLGLTHLAVGLTACLVADAAVGMRATRSGP
jgi:hypothetical protein